MTWAFKDKQGLLNTTRVVWGWGESSWNRDDLVQSLEAGEIVACPRWSLGWKMGLKRDLVCARGVGVRMCACLGGGR